jgi:hypothetical protein
VVLFQEPEFHLFPLLGFPPGATPVPQSLSKPAESLRLYCLSCESIARGFVQCHWMDGIKNSRLETSSLAVRLLNTMVLLILDVVGTT